MSNTSSKESSLFGMAYQKLQTELFKRHKYAEMRLSTYLSTRMGIEAWTFSSADIAHQTGLNRNTVYDLCNGLVEAGIFSVKEERRGCATIYNFDKTALVAYLQGDTATDGLGRGTCQSTEHPPASSTSRLTCQSAKHVPAIPTSISCLSDRHLPASPTGTIIKIDNAERKKTHKEEVSLCSFSLSEEVSEETLSDASLSATSKADAFIKYDNILAMQICKMVSLVASLMIRTKVRLYAILRITRQLLYAS